MEAVSSLAVQLDHVGHRYADASAVDDVVSTFLLDA